MSEYRRIKQTSEYREARAEVEALIKHYLKPIQLTLDELATAVADLEKKVAALQDR
jgi:hypothetical protein